MKSVLLSTAALLLLLGFITLRLRLGPKSERAKIMLYLFLAVLPLAAIIHLLTPANLYFLPDSWFQHAVWIDFYFMIFLYFAGFFGGLLQLYNLSDRGFSLRILIDILESKTTSLSLKNIMQYYGGGKGMGWMYQKRIDGMTSSGLVQIQGERLILTTKGRRAANLFLNLQKFYRVL